MNSRRQLLFMLAAGGLTPSFSCFAQPQKIYRLGILHSETVASASRRVEALTQALRELGNAEGKNLVIERRFAEGNIERLPALAADLVRLKVDVIFSPNVLTTRAAKQASTTIPIVFSNVGNPVGEGFIASLSRPGGNITGTSNIAPELSAKRLEILKESFPKISRVAVLLSEGPSNVGNPVGAGIEWNALQPAAKILGVQLLASNLRRREDFDQRLALLREWRVDAIFVAAGPTNGNNRKLLIEFASALRLPTIGLTSESTEDGGLMSYGANFNDLYRRSAVYIDKIFKGAKPADLPVEQPMTFELVINMKTAKALGLTIPPSILVRANRVIE